jgi:hypothetical protein
MAHATTDTGHIRRIQHRVEHRVTVWALKYLAWPIVAHILLTIIERSNP